MEKQLKSQRREYKTKITKFKSIITYFETGKTTLSELKLRLQVVETLLDKFEEVQRELENLESAVEAIEAAERNSFEDNYYEVVARAHDIIKEEEQSTAEVQQPASSSASRIQLPQFTLPKFNGDFTQWLIFKDTFSSAIHSNGNLNNVDKFRYLKGILQGDALQLVNYLETTTENYPIAWNLLIERYENDRIIIHNHMKGIFELTSIQKDSHTSLRQAIDSFQRHLRALQALKEPVETWDTMLIYLLCSKLDSITCRGWETEVGEKLDKRKPSFRDLMHFLSNRSQILEMTDKFAKVEQKQVNARKNAFVTTRKLSCYVYKEEHCIFQCPKILNLPIHQRQVKLKELEICTNCWKPNHNIRECKSLTNCRKCHKRHNTLLHMEDNDQQGASSSKTTDVPSGSRQQPKVTNHFARQLGYDVLISTAMVRVYNKDGKEFEARALLDSGSQSSFITNNLRQKLSLRYEKVNIPVNGINSVNTAITSKTAIKFKSNYNNFSGMLDCLVLEKITDRLPQFSVDQTKLKIPNIKLADPKFHISTEIDMLIGADMFWQLVCVGQIQLGRSLPTLQKTHLGWIISGPIHWSKKKSEGVENYHCSITSLDNQLRKFWELEDMGEAVRLSKDETEAENLYLKHLEREEGGRFIVGLPQKEEIQLRNSSQGALKRFYNLERQLDRNKELKSQYIEFMHQYESLGHMSEIKSATSDQQHRFILPHHAVRADSLSTKLRVVFDGSFKTTNGNSLNQKLFIGLRVQDELFNLLIRFRSHAFVLTADISMMFKQILIRSDHRQLQTIYWRETSNEPMKQFTLKTVTYETSSAPFLAARTLQQLAIEDGSNYSLAKTALLEDFYMDDLLSGANSVQEAIDLQQQLNQFLQRGEFPLKKWRSNNREVLKHLEEEAKEHELLVISAEEKVKTLGVLWNPKQDTSEYTIHVQAETKVSKRIILSQIATIFDPLGLLGPTIVIPKIMLQSLWQLNINWDDSVPQHIYTAWYNYNKSLIIINENEIPRHITPNSNVFQFDLHGFCDASMKAYVAIFVCFHTKAVHLEVVSGLTTEVFLAAFRRFCGRRGLCATLYSDNATNFVGANRHLKEMYDFTKENHEPIQAEMSRRQLKWNFIPPRGHHFGGLWEAAVKSMKRHLLKTTLGLILTLEETSTLLVEIEAVLNSRPLTPLSTNPTDLHPLTSAHFLIGDTLVEPMSKPYEEIASNLLSRWQHLMKGKQHFWRRWQQEYLHQLQVRSKWNTCTQRNIRVGDMVLLVEDNTSALQWPTGRITAVHPGDDSVVRVVSVQCASGVLKIPVRRLCLLPQQSD